MNTQAGKCLEQLNAEHGKAWLNAIVIAVVTIAFSLHGSVPYGPVHLMGIGGGTVALLFQIARLIPGSCCLRVCERGLIIRTLFTGQFLPWNSINEFSVQSTMSGDRVAVHVDPSLGIGRTLPLHFTYQLPPIELAHKLQQTIPTNDRGQAVTHVPESEGANFS